MGGRRYRKKTWREKIAFKNWGGDMLEYFIYQISAFAFCVGLLAGVITMAAIDRWII